MALQTQLLLELHKTVQLLKEDLFNVDKTAALLQQRFEDLHTRVNILDAQLDKLSDKVTDARHQLELQLLELVGKTQRPDTVIYNTNSSGDNSQLNQGANVNGERRS